MNDERPTRDPFGRFLPGNKASEGVQRRGIRPETADFKAMIRQELAKLGASTLHEWAQENPTEFYKIAARLIPQSREISGPDGKPIEHREVREYTTEELYQILEEDGPD
jgi:hypothetical protein